MTTWSTETTTPMPRRLAEQERELERLRAEVARVAGRRRPSCRCATTSTSRTVSGPRGRAGVHRRSTCRPTSSPPPGCPGEYPVHPRHPPHRCTAAGSGRCASSPASAAPSDTNERYKFLLEHGQTGLSVAFDFPTLMGYDSDHPRSEGEVGQVRRRDLEPRRHGDAVRRHPARPGLDVDDDQRPGRRSSSASTSRRPRSRACRSTKLRGTIQNDILKEYMAQHAWCYPDRARAATHRRPVRVGARARAAVEHDLDLRLPHPRSGRDGGAGAGVHARRRLHATSSAASRAGSTSTTSRRGSRSSGTSTTTSSRRSPSCAPRAASGRGTCSERYGAKDPRSLDDALPLADRRRDAHRAAADEQRRARRLPGAGRGARRHAVAAHQLAWTRRSRCRPRRRCRSRCARSRSSPTRPACPT